MYHKTLMQLSVVLVLALLGTSWAAADEAQDLYDVAAGLYSQGRYELAAEEFQAFLDRFPTHDRAGDARLFLGETLVQTGKLTEARRHFIEYLRVAPVGQYAALASFRRGEASYLQGEATALEELAAFTRDHPAHRLQAYALPYQGQLEFQAGRTDEARRHFDDALSRFPTGPLQDECRLGLARVTELSGQVQEAEVRYAALATKRSSPVADQAQFYLAALMYSQQRHQQAAEEFAALLQRHPDSNWASRAKLGRARALFHLQQFEPAGELFASLQADEQLAVEAGYWIALIDKAHRRWQPAAELLVKLCGVHPQHELAPAICFHAGDAYYLAGQRNEARAQYQRLIDQYPSSDWVDDSLLGLARLAQLENRHQEVEHLAATLERRFSGTPVARQAQRVLARSLLQRQQFDRAAETLTELLKIDGQSKAALVDRYLLAVAQLGLDQHQEALLTLAPVVQDAQGALQADALVSRAVALIALQRHSEAIEPLEAYLEAQPDGRQSLTCRAELTVCYAVAGRLKDAQRVYASLPEESGKSPSTHVATLRLAEELYNQDQFAEAEKLYSWLQDATRDEDLAARASSGLSWTWLKLGQREKAAGGFHSLYEEFPRHELAPQAALTWGQLLEQDGRDRQSLDAYRRVVDEYRDYDRRGEALMLAAAAADRLGEKRQADGYYQRLSEDHPDYAQMDKARYRWAWTLMELGRSKQALKQFQKLHSEHRQSSYWADATYRLAEHHLAEGRLDEADQLAGELIEAKIDGPLTAHAHYLRGRAAVAGEDWNSAATAMQQVMDNPQAGALKLQAEYWFAEAAFQQQEYKAAVARFENLAEKIEDESSQSWAPMVILRHAQSLGHQQQWLPAQSVVEQLANKHPEFERMYEADYLLGRCLASQAKFIEARAAYQRVIQSPSGGKTETAAMAQWMIGETYLHQKDYRQALKSYLRVEILYAYPTWQAAALLQAGKCYEQLGQWDQAAQLYLRVIQTYGQTEFRQQAEQRLKLARRAG